VGEGSTHERYTGNRKPLHAVATAGSDAVARLVAQVSMFARSSKGAPPLQVMPFKSLCSRRTAA
jgi:hypothetical protein